MDELVVENRVNRQMSIWWRVIIIGETFGVTKPRTNSRSWNLQFSGMLVFSLVVFRRFFRISWTVKRHFYEARKMFQHKS